jgi:hypothetical protein
MLRGKIYNRAYAAQVNDFSGMRWGNITPTDMDGLIEYHNKCFIFIETKFMDKPLPYGQKLAFERLVDSLNKPGILIVTTHNGSGDIDMKSTKIREYYWQGKWYPGLDIQLKCFVDFFIGIAGR